MKPFLFFIFHFSFLVSLQAQPLTEIIGKDGSLMILIPAGPFTMGSTNAEPDESPIREMSVRGFYMDTYEVTHEQYADFLKATSRVAPLDWPDGKMPAKLSKHPVVNVTWHDAAAYAKWAGKRLPTEAEWEKACRGHEGHVYPWGNAAAKKSASGRTFPVGIFPDDTSPYGVMDLAGNAWEWTQDCWRDGYASAPTDGSAMESGTCDRRVIRGGSWRARPNSLRSFGRGHSAPGIRGDDLGLRVVAE